METDPKRDEDLRNLARDLGITMHNMELFDRALTHASIAAEPNTPAYNYESLEFLGDAALGLATALHLYRIAPDRTPGEYSQMRAGLVNRRTLAHIAIQLNIAPVIRLGKGEELAGGRQRSALLADCLEALIGALYLDQGWKIAEAFIERIFQVQYLEEQKQDRVWDFKSRLQNFCQGEKIALPKFKVVLSEGPDHKKEFEVEVLLRGHAVGRGRGSTKKEAEQNAAREALRHEGFQF